MLSHHLKWPVLVLLILFFVLFPVLNGNPYFLHLATVVLIGAVSAVSVRLLMLTGQVSFAQAAFMGMGAYTTVLLVMKLKWNFWLSLPLAAIVPGLSAIPLGWIMLRIKGTYFFLASYALGEALRLLYVNWETVTNGASGISPIPRPHPFPLPWGGHLAFESGIPYYCLVLVITFILTFLMYRIEHSRIGKIFLAIREADSMAEAVGINIMRYKVLAFAVASAAIGVAGSLMAHYFRTISPEPRYFGLYQSMDLLVYVVVGGQHNFAGPILGAIVMKVVPEVLRIGRELQTFLVGAFLILALLFAPRGLIGLPRQIGEWVQRLSATWRKTEDVNT